MSNATRTPNTTTHNHYLQWYCRGKRLRIKNYFGKIERFIRMSISLGSYFYSGLRNTLKSYHSTTFAVPIINVINFAQEQKRKNKVTEMQQDNGQIFDGTSN